MPPSTSRSRPRRRMPPLPLERTTRALEGPEEALVLYRSGVLANSPLRAPQTPQDRMEGVTVVVLDRSPAATDTHRQLEKMFCKETMPSAWDLHPTHPFMTVIAGPGLMRTVASSTIKALVCEALPQAFANLMLTATPTTVLFRLGPPLELILRDHLNGLTQGQLPDPTSFPFAPPLSGTRLDCSCDIFFMDEALGLPLTLLELVGTPKGVALLGEVAPDHQLLDRAMWAQPDGSLHCRVELAGGDALCLAVERNGWRRITAAERRAGNLNTSSRLM
jgi:hypothetical protein